MNDGAPCPRCGQERTWWLPRMGYPHLAVYWCVGCLGYWQPGGPFRRFAYQAQAVVRQIPLAGVTDRQGDYARAGARCPRPVQGEMF